MHCIISTVVVAFEINYLILSYLKPPVVKLLNSFADWFVTQAWRRRPAVYNDGSRAPSSVGVEPQPVDVKDETEQLIGGARCLVIWPRDVPVMTQLMDSILVVIVIIITHSISSVTRLTHVLHTTNLAPIVCNVLPLNPLGSRGNYSASVSSDLKALYKSVILILIILILIIIILIIIL